jgi:hypothetical protein
MRLGRQLSGRARLAGALGVLLLAGCFNPQIAGGLISCPDGACPEGLVCRDGLCAAQAGGPCFTNLGCTPSLDCNDILAPCELGILCVDEASLAEVAVFQDGEVAGLCQAPTQLQAGDACTPLNILEACPPGFGCSEAGTCDDRTGEAGDSCDRPTVLPSEGIFLVNFAGFANDTADVALLCDPNTPVGDGQDQFFVYTVAGNNVDVIISTEGNGTLSDTVLYASTAGCDPNTNQLINTLACNDDIDFANGNLASQITLPNLLVGTTVTIVLDSFGVGREGFAELSIQEQ